MDTVLDQASELIARMRGQPLVDQQREKPALWQRAEEIFERAQGENRPMTAEESARYDELTAAITAVNERESQERTHRERQRQLLEPRRDGRMLPGGEDGADEAGAEYRDAVQSYIRAFRAAELGPEVWRALRNGQGSVSDVERRALGLGGGGAAGGYLVPASFQAKLIETMLAYAPVESIVSPLETSDGADIDWPTNDDTANTGTVVAENADVGTATDPAFGLKTLRAYLYTSRIFKAPLTLLQDAAIDVEAFIARSAGVRLGRILGTHFVSGTGVNQMEGITVGGAVGKTFASATAVTYAELVDLEHSVDPAYRAGPVRYLFNDSTLAALRKLVDGQGRPLWVPWLGQGVAGSVPATFNGWNYTIVQAMPSMATGNRSIAFGDFDRGYKYRRVSGFSLVRIEERYVEYGQVGFLMFARADGRVVDTAAFKLGAQA